MSSDQRAQILEAVVLTTCCVRDLVQVLGWKTANVISLLREMNEEKLIDLQQVTCSRRGRPKKNIVCTPLGLEFLEAYRRLKMKPLRAREEDLEHAMKDASYANRLVAYGHSPFQIFMELNAIARNIKVSSETSETV
jgi:molybdenum-dependent DNA-binding transcriptional regulator ModE